MSTCVLNSDLFPSILSVWILSMEYGMQSNNLEYKYKMKIETSLYQTGKLIRIDPNNRHLFTHFNSHSIETWECIQMIPPSMRKKSINMTHYNVYLRDYFRYIFEKLERVRCFISSGSVSIIEKEAYVHVQFFIKNIPKSNT